MKRFLAALFAACCLFSLSACGQKAEVTPPVQEEPITPPPEIPAPPTDAERAAERVGGLTLQEKVGQIFFARCPESGETEAVSGQYLGGILLFGRDFKDKTAQEVLSKNQTMQASAAIPLLIGVDEEGGTVVRASSNPLLRAKKFQSPQALYAKGGLSALVDDAAEKDALLKSLGINVNLAPVADVSTDPKDFIYPRALGQDAAATAEYVSALVEQMNLDGMGSVLKHFPGYGNNADTHTGVALDPRSMTQFREQDFLPFQAGIAAGAPAVLVSHNVMQAVDETLPASLSPAVHALLREELGFTGVSMTDDLIMDAVKAYAGEENAAVLAVLAGNDLLISSDFLTDIAAVTAAVEDGTIPMARLDQAVGRVLLWKMQLGLL